MEKLFEVQLRKPEKSCFFSSVATEEPVQGDLCIFELTQGTQDYGKILRVLKPSQIPAHTVITGKIIRKTNGHDYAVISENEVLKYDAFKICKEKIVKLELPMKLIDVAYSYDRTVITFYYWAEGRVDFRRLVKELAGVFSCRIEMRQIGLRDEAKMKDGYGICGQPICCARFLKEFEPIAMKLVKSQNLPLDMNKISGLCGRLMCCLIFESNLYEEKAEEENNKEKEKNEDHKEPAEESTS
ncbi:MAG: regulatory iron-sulfur-containing complex subunit RicT [Candidatus Ratteibacteria bacterium]